MSLTTGRRKAAVARVHMQDGTGVIQINHRPLEHYFPRAWHQVLVREPLQAVGMLDTVNVSANVSGGGSTGQAGAVRLGIARALLQGDETRRPTLRKSGLLTRDPRAKERKKYGQKGARKRFQWTKR
jgi:small subunit ribosomal protein S9